MLNAKKANAGMASVPYEPIHDVDLDGKPLPVKMCSDGWVITELSDEICKPYGGKEPVLPNSKPNTSSVNNNNASANSNASAINSLNNTTISVSSSNQFFEFSNGAKVPAASFNVNYLNDDGRDVIQAGISVPLGVKKSTILKDVERTNQLEEARFCLDLVNSRVTMNQDRMTFFDCDGFTYPEVELHVPVDNSAELETIKAEMKEYLNQIKELRQTNEALQLRLIQMKVSNTPIPAKY